MINISIICPIRNNLKYFKWAYKSIRENQGNHLVEICVADDASTDGTWEWCQEIMKGDSHFKAIRNEGPERLGHTILYDKLINEVASYDICMIFHADMFLCPDALDYIEKYIKPKTIVSLTRIEPPLHPPGPEKVLMDFGTEPEQFDRSKFFDWFMKYQFSVKDKTTAGVFAPWAFYKTDFQEIGGHDPLYRPQSKEDSDIFNRFQLNGVSFIQTWEGCVYHMTCRGSRFNPTLTTPGKNSEEWEKQNEKSTRNFIRKWGHFVKHDEYMKPIVPHKYDIGFVVENCNHQLLALLEPWCSNIYVKENYGFRPSDYIENEDTDFDLRDRVKFNNEYPYNNIIVSFDASKMDQEYYNTLMNLSDIITETNDLGEFELGIFKIEIKDLTTFENKLIVLDK